MAGLCLLCGRVSDDVEVHHIGGRAQSVFTVTVCGPCHHGPGGLTAAQAPYQHLLAQDGAPGWLRRALWEADLAAFLERLAAHLRRDVRDLVAPHLHDAGTRVRLGRAGRRAR